jgi:hypothetical protein
MPEAVLRWVDVNVLGWLQARERKALKFTVVAQLVILVAMIGLRAIPLVTGHTVLVRVQPVDPRDLFRGDYVILSYDFSRASRDSIQGLAEPGALAGRQVHAGKAGRRALSQGADGPLRLTPVRDRVVLRAGGHRPHVRAGNPGAQALGRAGGDLEWPGCTEVAAHRVSLCHPERSEGAEGS